MNRLILKADINQCEFNGQINSGEVEARTLTVEMCDRLCSCAMAFVTFELADGTVYESKVTASMMHGSSRNSQPVREGFVAMIAPLTDSGLVCTLTSLAILSTGYSAGEGIKGLQIAIDAFGKAIPGVGEYLLLAILFHRHGRRSCEYHNDF